MQRDKKKHKILTDRFNDDNNDDDDDNVADEYDEEIDASYEYDETAKVR